MGLTFHEVVSLAELEEEGRKTVQVDGQVIALFAHQGQVYAVDNRCPHMGFPLDRGTVDNGILTCHWHHARFDLESGGTFDLFADDVPCYPVEVRAGAVWVGVGETRDRAAHQRQRLEVGLEQNISLVIAKAALVLGAHDLVEPFRIGLAFGTRYRRAGWGQGLTILTCMANLLPALQDADQPRALFHGLSAVAAESAGAAPRFAIEPLPDAGAHDFATLKRWLRQFVAVRDEEGAERCVVTAIKAGATPQQMAEMLFTAVTDFRYIDTGHPADFTNKAFEALDLAGWEYAAPALTSLVRGYARANRREESNAWRHPIDLVALLEEAFARLPEMELVWAGGDEAWEGDYALAEILLEDDPAASVGALLAALADGVPPVSVAAAVSYAAALRIARFHTSNEFGDWDTALHTFTFANAMEQGLRRAPAWELLRGVFDAAMSIYLDRFLNIPPARLPQPNGQEAEPEALLAELAGALDRQQQVNEAGALVASFLHRGGDPERLLAQLGHLLLREDRDFHTIQAVEAAFRQFARWRGTPRGTVMLVAAARYLAAHAPTVRAQEQTYSIALRLKRGERLFEG